MASSIITSSMAIVSSTPQIVQTPASCATSSDCSLNGDCINSTCVCDPWWFASPTCDVLALLPASKMEGYHNSSGISSWGGMSIREDSTNTWHLFAAEMENMCGLSSWTTNSRVVRGVSSKGPAGPFDIVQALSVPFSHNPKIFTDPVTGLYLLFSIGTGLWTTAPQNCTKQEGQDTVGVRSTGYTTSSSSLPGPCGDGCGPASEGLNSGCGLSLGVSSSLDGPWTFSSINITDQNRSTLLDCAHTNPSPWIFPNGSILMAINAGFCHSQLETIGLLQAPSFKGPWSFFTPDPILHNDDGSVHVCEDPFLWFDHRGFHLMVHNQQGEGVSRYAHSLDAFNWTLHSGDPGPYSDFIQWDDGTSSSFDVERPQFIFDPDTGNPLYLTNGAYDTPSFTLFRPLSQVPPPPPPAPVSLVNAQGLCFQTTGAFPCWNASGGAFGICPVVAAACTGGSGSNAVVVSSWVLYEGTISDPEGHPLNVDCDHTSTGSLVKLITSGPSPLFYNATTQQIIAGTSAVPTSGSMCLTTGGTGATAPCGGGAEPWLSTQIHLDLCTSSNTVGWQIQK